MDAKTLTRPGYWCEMLSISPDETRLVAAFDAFNPQGAIRWVRRLVGVAIKSHRIPEHEEGPATLWLALGPENPVMKLTAKSSYRYSLRTESGVQLKAEVRRVIFLQLTGRDSSLSACVHGLFAPVKVRQDARWTR